MSPAKPIALKTVAIVGKYLAEGIAESLSEIAEFLDKRGHTVIFESETAQNIALDGVTTMTPDTRSAGTRMLPSSWAATARCWGLRASSRNSRCR